MSHPEQLAFARIAARCADRVIAGGRVLEIGSFDVNGNVRGVFRGAAEHVGVDLVVGPAVDVVGSGHLVDLGTGAFDASVSFSCLEHDEHWAETLANMVRMTRPGGVVIFSCASTRFPEHGTRRSDPTLSPGTQGVGSDHYRNLAETDFRGRFRLDDMFESYGFWYLRTSFDLLFMGRLRGGDRPGEVDLPSDEEIADLERLMTLPHRLVRIPLRVTYALVGERRYQGIASRYWRWLALLQRRLLRASAKRA